MDLKLLEIAGKQAGIYFIVTDNSAVPAAITTSNLRLVPINSPKGPVNTVVVFQSGDTASFENVFGKSTRQMERKGNQSLKTALKCLEAGPVAVINLRSFDDEQDKTQIRAFSANSEKGETQLVPYTRLYNMNQLWTVTPKYMANLLTQKHLLNIGNIGTSDISVFIVVSTHVDSVTSEGDNTLGKTELEIEEYPALNPEMLLKDTFVDVYVFNNTFNVADVTTNKYYGQFFDTDGNVDLSRLEELTEIPEAGFNRRFTGSLIPNLKSESGESISIDTVINQAYSETGLVAFINDEVLESDDLNTIDFDGSTFYDEEGNRLESASETMLSHVAPAQIHKTFVAFPPTSDMVKVIEDQEVIFETERYQNNDGTLDETSFIGVFEQGVRVGDRIKGINSSVVEVTGIEIIESNVPAPDPEGPKQNYKVTLKSSLNGSYTVTANGNPVVSGNTYEEGSMMTVKAEANENFKLGKISVNGKALPEGVTTFTLTGESVIEVLFAEITYKVLIATPENGTVTVSSSKGEVENNDDVQKGTELTIVPNPAEGYQIGTVKANDIELKGPEYKGVVREDTNIEVTFIPKKYTVYVTEPENGTFSLADADGETIAPNTAVDYNSIVVINPVPAEHYETDQIIVDGTPLDEGISQFVVPAKDVVVSVSFKKKQYKVEFSDVAIGGSFVVKNGQSQLSSGALVDALTEITIEATPEENMQVDKITVNDADIESSSFSLVGDSVVKVTFSKIMHVVSKVNPSNGEFTVETSEGTPVVSGTAIAQGTELFVVTTPAAHYRLKQVLVNDTPLEAEESQYRFVVDEPKKVEVIFEPILWEVTVTKEEEQVDVEIQTLAGEKVDDLSKVMDGTTLKVVATAKTGYHITDIKANQTSILSTKVFNVTGATTVEVVTEINKYRVTINQPENGTITVKNGQTPVSTGEEVEHGTVLTAELAPETGYHKVSFTANSVKVTGNVTVTEAVTFAAVVEIDKHTVTFVQPDHATLTVKNGEVPVTSGEQVDYGTVLTIEAVAAEHYNVTKVSVNSEEQSGSPITVTVTEDITAIDVETAIKQYTVTYEQPENAKLAVTKTGGIAVPTGSKVDALTELIVTLTLNEGYEKKSVKANNVEIENNRFVVDKNSTVVAEVSIKKFTVTVEQPANGTITANHTSTVDWGTEVTVTAEAADYYELKTFTDNGEDKLASKDSYVFTVKENHTLTGTTEKIMYTLSYEEPENGTLDVKVNDQPHTSGEEIWAGDTVTATATPNENYTLESLKYNQTSITSGSQFKITENTSVVAVFAPIMRTVTKNPATGGSYQVKQGVDFTTDVSDSIMQGTTIKIVPSAEKYYQLKSVKVNSTPLESPYTYLVASENVTIDVEFEKIRYTVTYTADAGNGNSVNVKNGLTPVASGTEVDAGTVVTVETVVAENYELTELTANETDILSTKEYKVEQNTTIEATFTKPQLAVTYVTTGLQGTLSVTRVSDHSAIDSGDTVAKGEQIKLEYTPAADEVFTKFVVSTPASTLKAVRKSARAADTTEDYMDNPATVTVTKQISAITVETSKKQATVNYSSTLGEDYKVEVYDYTGDSKGSLITSGSKVDYGKQIKLVVTKVLDSTEVEPENVSVTIQKDAAEAEPFVYGTSYTVTDASTITFVVSPKA